MVLWPEEAVAAEHEAAGGADTSVLLAGNLVATSAASAGISTSDESSDSLPDEVGDRSSWKETSKDTRLVE